MSASETLQGADAVRELANLERRHAELQILYHTIRDLTSTLSVREVLDRLLARVLDHLGAEIGSVLLLEGEVMRIVAARGLPQEIVDQTAVTTGSGVSGYVLETGEPLFVEDIETDPRFRKENNERYYTSSLICAPIVYSGKTRGVINVNNKLDKRPFDEGDLALLQALAGHASIALANAREYEETLARSRRDALTGVANHGYFWSNLEVEHRRASRHGRTLGFVMFDIDGFDSYVDAYGKDAGNDAIRAFANLLETKSRVHDFVARYGGTTFAVVLPETPPDGTFVYAEKIRQAFAELPLGPDGKERLTASAGLASSDSGTLEPRELVRLADERLYRAKNDGNRTFGEQHE